MLTAWNILICLLWPVLCFYRPFRGTLRERLGHFELGKFDPQKAGLKVLINAVSAGEVNAIAPFIRELKKLRPDAQVALMTTTDSGLEMARKKLRDDVELITFFPLIDLPFATRRFLDKLVPDLYITTEAEIWPNIQSQCNRRGIQTALVNGRIYMHNKTGWRRLLLHQLLLLFDLIVCQDDRQCANFLKFGIPRERLTVSGNIKFDFDLPVWSEQQLTEWRTGIGLGPTDQVVVAGSTHDGEETVIVEGTWDSSARLIIAPRHIERAPQIQREFSVSGKPILLSELEPGSKVAWETLIVDRYGVLVDFYRLADVVIMGGTFNPKVGGHNVLEATELGKPVIVGPVTFGITAQVEMLDSVGGLEHASNGQQLADKVKELLANPARATAIGQAAKEVTDANRGAAKRAAEQVLSLFPAPTMQA